jgi:hypothetical protein
MHIFTNLFKSIVIEASGALRYSNRLVYGSASFFGTRCASRYVNTFLQGCLAGEVLSFCPAGFPMRVRVFREVSGMKSRE